MTPKKVTRNQLESAARAALGGGRRLKTVERLSGGTTKGVYRLTMDDATTAIAYLWEDSENYWPSTEHDGDLSDPFSPGVGIDLFEAAHARLGTLGLRVLEIHLTDRDRTHYPADLAIVEDVPGENLMDLRNRDPRAEYSVVHGELGMDHVMVDRDGHPLVIDIEDLLYFDVEWEHVFLRLRHTPGQYQRLMVDGLDEDRVALYRLTQHLSLTAGRLRLLDGDYADRVFMRGVAEHHLNAALALVPAS